ncbi:MAG: histidine kinase [Saprospiraceae bacterium]|nr:histidine kinase [Saprospiraceae bacterium]
MKYALNLFFFTCSCMLATAQPGQVYELKATFDAINAEGEGYHDLYTYTQLLVDPTQAWTYEEVLQKNEAFTENTTREDWNIEKVYWVKLQLQSPQTQRALFSAGYLFGDYAKVDIYYEHQDALIVQHTGSRRKAAEKTIRRMGSYFWVDMPADTFKTVYLRIDNANWPCDCWDRNPVSIYHIDPSSIMSLSATYVLHDFSSLTNPPSIWEPGRILRSPGGVVKPNIWLTKAPSVASLGRYFEFYPDESCSQSLAEVQENWDQHAFFRGFQGPEFEAESCQWARLSLYNPKPTSQTRTFAYWDYPWKEIEYYLPDSLGKYIRYKAQPRKQDQEAFTFIVPAEDTLMLYIRYPVCDFMRAKNGSLVDVPKEDLNRQAQLGHYKFLLVGGFIFFLIYCFLQLMVDPEWILFYYFLMILGFFPFLLLSLDFTHLFVFTDMLLAHLPYFSVLMITNVAGLLATLGFLNFTRVSLKLNVYLPKYGKLIYYLMAVETVLTFSFTVIVVLVHTAGKGAGLLVDVQTGLQDFLGLFHAFVGGFILWIGLHAFVKKVPLGKSFLIANLPLCLAVVYTSIAGYFDFAIFLPYLPFIVGLLSTLMLFGVLVASRSNLLKQEEYKAAQQKIMLENQLLQIESKALRAQMNPHFIFNCLNSIKSLIQDQDNKKAIHYLTLFSKFIRSVLHYSDEKHITLEEELKLCQTYLEMEKLRFEKSFSYRLEIAPNVDTSFIKVPPMILQPFLENAIWHGLMHKEGDRELKLLVQSEGEATTCIIEDNGIGRAKAKLSQVDSHHTHKSFGTQLIQDRLRVNNQLFNSQFVVNIIDKVVNGKAEGTQVELHLGH